MEAMKSLDAGGHVHNQEKVNELINIIREEFPEVELINSGMFLGILAKCYLGIPYEVHTLSFSFSIIEHYKKDKLYQMVWKKQELWQQEEYMNI